MAEDLVLVAADVAAHERGLAAHAVRRAPTTTGYGPASKDLNYEQVSHVLVNRPAFTNVSEMSIQNRCLASSVCEVFHATMPAPDGRIVHERSAAAGLDFRSVLAPAAGRLAALGAGPGRRWRPFIWLPVRGPSAADGESPRVPGGAEVGDRYRVIVTGWIIAAVTPGVRLAGRHEMLRIVAPSGFVTNRSNRHAEVYNHVSSRARGLSPGTLAGLGGEGAPAW